MFLLVALVHLQMGDVVRLGISKDAQGRNVCLIPVCVFGTALSIPVGVLNIW